MKLAGDHIRDALNCGIWKAYRRNQPITSDDLKIGPNSVDVTLHPKLLIPRPNGLHHHVYGWVDVRDPEAIEWDEVIMDSRGYVLKPGQFILGAVQERFECHEPILCVPESYAWMYFAPMYEGRSTCGRIGLASHITAGFGDYGFSGAFTLEILSAFPADLVLFPGMRIGQVAFEQVSSPSVRYSGAYSSETHYDGPVPPVIGKDRF